ncbi:MAG: acetyl-CoA carboxylase biotin carboxyl carrier protein [Elusimicrobiota bacterium]
MNAAELKDALSWIRETDLVEVLFHERGNGFSLSLPTSPSVVPADPDLSGRCRAVCAPAVGIFQWSRPGRARTAEQGAEIKEGQTLGVIESGTGEIAEIKAPSAGRIARVFIEAGAAVDFGRLLFFIES